MPPEHSHHVVWTYGRALLLASLIAVALWAIFIGAPSEQTMGAAQRIVYIHVAVAWFGLLGFVAMATAGVSYLIGRDLKWDQWFQAVGEVGWLSCGLTLITGAFWAHEAWGTWWTWDPRLTTSFVLWATYSGILIVRAGLDDPHQRARIGAILAVLGGARHPTGRHGHPLVSRHPSRLAVNDQRHACHLVDHGRRVHCAAGRVDRPSTLPVALGGITGSSVSAGR